MPEQKGVEVWGETPGGSQRTRFPVRTLVAAVLIAAVVAAAIFFVRNVQGRQNVQRFRTDAEQAIQALDAVAAAVAVGVIYADYAKRVADAKAAVDRFLRKWPTDVVPPLRVSVSGAMEDYTLALEVWGQRIKGGSWVSDRHELAPKLLAVPGNGTGNHYRHIQHTRAECD